MAVPSLPVGLPLGTPHRPYTLMPGDTGGLVEDVWPSIYFGAERLPAIREKTNGAPWARSMLARLVAEAEGVLAEEPSQPLERIGWRHQFYSKSSGEHLLYERHSPHGFLDPASGGLEAGEEEHAAWVLLTHERTHRLLRSLALLHGLTGDARYAAWVREGLLRAVEFFGHDEFREGNRCRALYFQPLYDGPALTQMAMAYDLTREAACYSEADHQAIIGGVFEKGIPYQLEFLDEIGVHNMGCYVSAAVATCGQVLGRPEWVERGLRHPLTGLHGQLRDGVRSGPNGQPDGFWYEGTMFYHFYSLCPLITLWELARTLGDPLAADADVRERLAAGLLAPVNLADSRDRLPILGDLGDPRVMSLETYRHLYEWAAGRLDPERFGPIAARLAQRCGRDGWTALALGATDLPSAEPPLSRATLLPRPGIGVFRSSERELYCLFKAGPHGAGHDHLDKLEVVLHGLGEVIAPDVGTGGYSLKTVHPFYRGTLSHSTLVVDEANQRQVAQAELDWQPEEGFAVGRVSDAYEGVCLTRRLWFDPPYVVLLDSAESADSHRYGWLFHAYGSLRGAVSAPAEELALPELPDEGGWQHFVARRRAATRGWLEARWRVTQQAHLRLLATSDGLVEATTARTPGNPFHHTRGTVLLRAVGATRHFATVLEVHPGAASVEGISLSERGVVVTTSTGRRCYGEVEAVR